MYISCYLIFIGTKHNLNFLILQHAALNLGVLTSEEFEKLVVPEKMIGPSDWNRRVVTLLWTLLWNPKIICMMVVEIEKLIRLYYLQPRIIRIKDFVWVEYFLHQWAVPWINNNSPSLTVLVIGRAPNHRKSCCGKLKWKIDFLRIVFLCLSKFFCIFCIFFALVG